MPRMIFTIPRPCPELLWREGAYLTPAELSGLLERCTSWTLETTEEDEETCYYLRTPGGERLDDGFPFFDLESVGDFVGWRIDEALGALDS